LVSHQNRESRETDNIGYTRRRKNTKCVGHHFNLVENRKKTDFKKNLVLIGLMYVMQASKTADI
jgi:hypothetical protein